jgi:ATP-binding cassette subfamily C (CFTR/MRP) protein 1
VTKEDDGRIIKDENEEVVVVGWDTYKELANYSGGWNRLFWMSVCVVLAIVCDTWLRYYIGEWALNQGEQATDTNRFGIIILSLALVSALMVFSRSVIATTMIFIAGNKAHTDMIRRVLRAPINLFYDVTPTGLIINRFSGDIGTIEGIIMAIMWAAGCFWQVISVIVIIAWANWSMLIIVPFILAYLIYIFKFTIGSYREMHRLQSVMKSPILTHLGESISGNSTIRAFDSRN